ncbi:MAG: hypothetical protein AAGK32_08280 [Actinomycetota bacterium]
MEQAPSDVHGLHGGLAEPVVRHDRQDVAERPQDEAVIGPRPLGEVVGLRQSEDGPSAGSERPPQFGDRARQVGLEVDRVARDAPVERLVGQRERSERPLGQPDG